MRTPCRDEGPGKHGGIKELRQQQQQKQQAIYADADEITHVLLCPSERPQRQQAAAAAAGLSLPSYCWTGSTGGQQRTADMLQQPSMPGGPLPDAFAATAWSAAAAATTVEAACSSAGQPAGSGHAQLPLGFEAVAAAGRLAERLGAHSLQRGGSAEGCPIGGTFQADGARASREEAGKPLPHQGDRSPSPSPAADDCSLAQTPVPDSVEAEIVSRGPATGRPEQRQLRNLGVAVEAGLPNLSTGDKDRMLGPKSGPASLPGVDPRRKSSSSWDFPNSFEALPEGPLEGGPGWLYGGRPGKGAQVLPAAAGMFSTKGEAWPGQVSGSRLFVEGFPRAGGKDRMSGEGPSPRGTSMLQDEGPPSGFVKGSGLLPHNEASQSDEAPSFSSAWEACGLYPLTPTLSPGSLLQSESDRFAWGTPPGSSGIGASSSSPYTTAAAAAAGVRRGGQQVQDELAGHQSVSDGAAAYCCPRTPGRSWRGATEETEPSYESFLLAQLAQCRVPPNSEASSRSPSDLPRSSGDEDECFFSAPGDADACESLGPCVPPVVCWAHKPQLPPAGGPFSVWYTLGRLQPRPRRLSEHHCCFSWGAAASRRRRSCCPRAFAAVASGAPSACCYSNARSATSASSHNLPCGCFACGQHPHDFGLSAHASWSGGCAGFSCRSASQHLQQQQQHHCSTSCLGRPAGALPLLRGVAGEVCRRHSVHVGNSCCCSRRCNRPLRLSGPPVLWSCKDSRELKSYHRANAVHLDASRRGPEVSRCNCPAAAGESNQQPGAARTAAGGSNTAHCCISHLEAFNQSSQAPCKSMAAAAAGLCETRGRRDSWRGQQGPPGSWDGSPLLLSRLCNRRGEGGSTGDSARAGRSQHHLGCLPDAPLCCLSSRRPSRSCTSYTTACSSLSPSRGLGIVSSRSSASATSSQPALSPQTPSSFFSLILKPAEAHQELDKQAAADATEEAADTATEIPAVTPAQFESSKEGAFLENKAGLADHEREAGQQQQQQSGKAHRCPCYSLGEESCACTRQRQNVGSSSTSIKGSSFDESAKSAVNPQGSEACEGAETPSLAAARSWGWCQQCSCEPPLRRRTLYSVEAPASAAQLLQLDACSPAFTAVRPHTESSTVADSLEENRGGTPAEGFTAIAGKGDPFFAVSEATGGPQGGPQWLEAATSVAELGGGGAAAAACPPCVAPLPKGAVEPGNSYIPKSSAPGGAPATEAVPFAGGPYVPLSASGGLQKGKSSGEDADVGAGGVASRAALLGAAVHSHGEQVDPRQPQTVENSAGRGALPQSNAGGLGDVAPEPQGRACIAASGDDFTTAASKLVDGGSLPGCEISTPHKGAVAPFGANWEAGDMLVPGMQQDRETEETFVPLEEPGGPGEGLPAGCEGDADSAVGSGLLEPNNNPREALLPPALLSGSGVSPCHENPAMSTNLVEDQLPQTPNKWLGSHAHAPPNADSLRLGAAPPHPLPLQDAGSTGPPHQGALVPTSSSRTEGSGGPLLDSNSCLISLDGVQPDAGLGDGAATQLITGACGELGSGGGGAAGGGSVGPPFKRKAAGSGCCLPPATPGPRIGGLQPRPPPPRVYHVVMCTRRYWRVEWVSPETGRRVYKHFGENRYGGGDRAREVAVKFWAEVRKRSADGVERGEWQGLTEVTRRVREEGVEGILEEVRAPPSLTPTQQHTPSATGSAAAQTQPDPNAGACVGDSASTPQPTIPPAADQQQQLQQQATPHGSNGAQASGVPTERGFGVSEQQQQEDHAAASAADGFRQRGASLRASRGRLREAIKETSANSSSVLSQQQAAPSLHEEDETTMQDGGSQLGLHASTDKETPEEQQHTAAHQQPQQQHLGPDAYPPIDCLGGTQGPPGYSAQQQQHQGTGEGSEHTCVAPMQQQQGCSPRGLEARGAVVQLAEGPAPPVRGGGPASLVNSSSGVETAAHAGVSTGGSEWGVVQQQALGQPPPVQPQIPLYGQPLGGLPNSTGRLWGPSTGDSGAEPPQSQLPEDLESVKAGRGEPGAQRREAGGEGCCSAAGSVESAAKRYRPADPSEVVLPETPPSWVASEHAYPSSSNNSSSGSGSVPLLHASAGPEHGGGMQLEAPLGPSSSLAQGDYRLAAAGGEACMPVSLPTGSTRLPSSDTGRTHWTSCSMDTPASLGSVMSPLAFHDVRLAGAGGASGGTPNGGPPPCHLMQDYSNQSGAAAGIPSSFPASSSTSFTPCDLQLALQQQQQQLAPQQGPTPTPLDNFPMQFLPDTVYGQQQQQQRVGFVRTPGVRTPTPGSAVSSSRRSRCSGSSSSRKGASGAGGSGRSGGGGGGGSHGTRTLGRIYSLLVRGVRCWRAEWHDRTSGHRKTRQYAAPKHGEQQARALCLQALCQARSVPAQLLKEAQQTFAYEPTLSPDQVSEVGEPQDSGGGGPSATQTNASYLLQPRQQQQRIPPATSFLHGAAGAAAPACLDPSGQLISAPLQHGEADFNSGSSGYGQPAGYFWPPAGFSGSASPFTTGFADQPAGPPLLGALDQSAYAQNHPQDPLQQQHRLLGTVAAAGAGVGGPPESSSSTLIRGSPASNVGPHSGSSSTGFALDGSAATELSPPAFGDSNSYEGVKVAPPAAPAAAAPAAGGPTCGLAVSGMVAPDDVVGVKQELQRAAMHADSAGLYTTEASAEGPATPAPLSASSSSAPTPTFY